MSPMFDSKISSFKHKGNTRQIRGNTPIVWVYLLPPPYHSLCCSKGCARLQHWDVCPDTPGTGTDPKDRLDRWIGRRMKIVLGHLMT